MITAFLTGSRVYGKPHGDSDLDLVLLVSDDDREVLAENADSVYGSGNTEVESVLFGGLNIIAMTDRRKFDAWQRATDRMRDRFRKTGVPVTRDEAVDEIQAEVASAGLHHDYDRRA